MIILDTTTRKIEVLLGGTVTTNQLPIVASYIDYIAGTSYTPATNQTQTNNVTAVVAVAAPTGSAVRQVKFIQVQNADTALATVTVRYNDNGTTRNLIVIVINPGEQLNYEDGAGWNVVNVTGALVTTNTLTFTSGGVLSGSIGNNAIVSGSIASGQINQSTFSSGVFTLCSGNLYWNYMLNGGQEYLKPTTILNGVITTAGISGGDTEGPNLFYGAIQSGAGLDLRCSILNNLTSPSSEVSGNLISGGMTSRFLTKWFVHSAQFDSANFAIYQPIRAVESQNLTNKNISFQAQMRTNAGASGLPMYMGILQTNSGCTSDVVPNSIVSGWNATTIHSGNGSGTFPTWGSGVSMLSSSGILCNLGGTWQVYNTTALASSGHVNLIPAIWTNGAVPGVIPPVYIAEVGLYED